MTILSYGEIDLDIYLSLDRLPTMEHSANVRDEFENVSVAPRPTPPFGWLTGVYLRDWPVMISATTARAKASVSCLPRMGIWIQALSAGTRIMYRRAANASSHQMASAASLCIGWRNCVSTRPRRR